MNVLSICDNPEVLEVMMIIKIIVQGICIIVPIILIVKLCIEFMKEITSDSKNIGSDINKIITYRAIAAIIIFFIPSFIKLIVYVADSDANSYYSCIENATPEMIDISYQNSSKNKIDKIKESFDQNDYNNAKISISNIKDENIRQELSDELNSLEKYVDIKNRINSLINNYNKNDFISLNNDIENISDQEIKNYFTNLLSEISNQKPLNIESGTYKKKFTGSVDWINYYEFIPNNPTTNMPIVVFLHGSGETGKIDALKDLGFIRGTKNVYGDDFPYIVLQPNTRVANWPTTANMTTVKELIDSTCEEYSCDKEHIIITGMSMGAVGTWGFVNKYKDYFSAAVPVSCGGGIVPESYLNVPVRAFVGEASDDYQYYSAMLNNVNKIKNIGGDASLEVVKGGTHNSTYHTVYSRKELIEWMLEQ